MKNLKKILSLVLVISMLSGFVVSNAATTETTYTWELKFEWPSTGAFMDSSGLHRPFKPADKYVSQQNPPDFSWPYVHFATKYVLEIYTNEDCVGTPYKTVELNKNYYNFNETFETGVNYYWRVKYYKDYRNSTPGWSVWSDVRRFKIDPDAIEFKVPDTETLISRVPTSHPRVFTTPETLDDFRKIKDTNKVSKDTYDYFVSSARVYAEQDLLPELAVLENKETSTNIVLDFLKKMYESGYAYLLSGEEKIGAFAKKALMLLADIDYTADGPTAFHIQNQRHRECIFKGAMVYDWIYELLNTDERKKVQDMIVGRVEHEYPTASGSTQSFLEVVTTKLEQLIFESHAWTQIGYFGIAAYALYDDVPEAEEWLEKFFPLYIATMHPWSNEDGGWSQGTYYWSASTNGAKIIMDVLKLGGVFDLYKKPWVENEALWTMYTYPKGSYGSFGDGSGLHLAESDTANKYVNSSMIRLAKFTDNKLARWLANDIAEPVVDNPYNYYSGSGYYGEMISGNNYAPSHAFKDVGWAVMTSDLEDPDRVQLTFKSSPYGTYGHSNADQNSFFIQAFGEKLAVRRGYYDSYTSGHHANFSRASFSHNTITINGNYGQVDNNINAKGNLSQFVTQLDFDSVTGEAADAYNTALNPDYKYADDLKKYDRNIIYIRPGVFLVIDDLEAKEGETATFEWHLATHKRLDSYTNNSATVTKGDAVLSADVLYPATTKNYYDTYQNKIDGEIYKPSDEFYKNYNIVPSSDIPYSIRFVTGATEKTKMVVSMSVYKNGETKNYPAVTGDNTYKKLAYSAGTAEETTVLVNLQDKAEAVTVDGITFKGTAVTFNKNSIMLTNGTYLKVGEKELINADRDVTVALGHGQICISSGDDYNITLDSNNDYLTVTDISSLKDDKGRSLSAAIGVSAKVGRTVDTNILTLSADKGNYTILNGDAGIISPSELVVENIVAQKTAEEKAAIFWDVKDGRSYQVKLPDGTIKNTDMPYKFDLTKNVHYVYLRENLGDVLGSWSEPVYLSKYEKEKHDKVAFSKVTEDGKNYIKAETIGLPSYGFFDMYLGKYNADGKLIGSAKATGKDNLYSTKIEEGTGEMYKAFLFGKDIAPLASVAQYNTNSTDLSGIYIDGVLIDGFSNDVDKYEITFEEDRTNFPFVTAKVADNSSKVDVKYDFDALKASITVTAPNGDTREVIVKFKYANVHVVEGATEDSNFGTDSNMTTDPDGNLSYRAKNYVVKLYYKDPKTGEYVDLNTNTDNYTGLAYSSYYNLFTNMKGDGGGIYRGSRYNTNRHPNGYGHYEICELPEEFWGYDYFTFWMELESNMANKYEGADLKIEFDLAQDAEVVILSKTEKQKYLDAGFKQEPTLVKTRYISNFGPEDLYFNIDLLGKDISELNKYSGLYFLKDYDDVNEWYNVKPPTDKGFSSSSTYVDYQASGLKVSDFEYSGTAETFFASNAMTFSYKYTKVFEADPATTPDVSFAIDYSSKDVIVIKPKALKPFN